jgi:hypothetical protein
MKEKFKNTAKSSKMVKLPMKASKNLFNLYSTSYSKDLNYVVIKNEK